MKINKIEIVEIRETDFTVKVTITVLSGYPLNSTTPTDVSVEIILPISDLEAINAELSDTDRVNP